MAAGGWFRGTRRGPWLGGAFPSLPMREGMERPAESLGGSCGADAQQGFPHDPRGQGSEPVGVGTGPQGRTHGEARLRLQSNRALSVVLLILPGLEGTRPQHLQAAAYLSSIGQEPAVFTLSQSEECHPLSQNPLKPEHI